MPIGFSCMEESSPPRDIMETSRLSESSESDAEPLPSFAQSTSMFDAPSNHAPSKKRRYSFEDNKHDDGEPDLRPPEKKTKDIGKLLMEKMGYSEGFGLGKHGQGRLQPVEASDQKGRRGLGHDNIKLKEAIRNWDPIAEVVALQEDMMWVSTFQDVPLNDELRYWMKFGPSKNTVDDETLFCDPEVLQNIINSKSVFDNLGRRELKSARTRSNPFETIRGAFFQNRAAVKMANMDRACNFMFTNPQNYDHREPLYFADVCAGPGGFSEYVLWRKKWHAKGFGFTLKESNDFKLDEFYAGSPETFHPFYGPKDNGDVYDPDNQRAFRRLIMQQTKGKGVHFMMADGGFSVENQHTIQELLSKQLYLCQCLVALMIVREGGHFVTKLFDLFTPFSVGLVYLMYRCFKRVCIFKPNTSRPANSERYLICQDKLANTDDVMEYLNLANELLLRKNKEREVMQLVPLDILKNEEQFYQYIKESNDALGRKQVIGLSKIAAFCENADLSESRQLEMKKDCLKYWELPDLSRTTPSISKPEERLVKIFGSALNNILKKSPKVLTLDNMDETPLTGPCEWFCTPCEFKKSPIGQHVGPTLYFGMGRTKVYQLIGDKWESITNIELPPDTLVYAELVTEYRGQHKSQRKTTALHIIDAWFLGGEDIGQKELLERQMLIKKFCSALWKPENREYFRVRSKELYSFHEDLPKTLKLEPQTLKQGHNCLGHFPPEPHYSVDMDNNEKPFFFVPSKIMFLKCTAEQWSLVLSRTTLHHYYYNYETDEKEYPCRRPNSAVASFASTFENRIIWNWPEDQSFDNRCLYDRIRQKCPKISNQR